MFGRYKHHFAWSDYTIKMNPKGDFMLLNGLYFQIKVKCVVLARTQMNIIATEVRIFFYQLVICANNDIGLV
jgi:hypothetical protein